MRNILVAICIFTSIVTFSQQPEYEVVNTSVNSRFAELGVTFLTENEVIFASSKKDNSEKNFSKDRRRNNRQLYLDFYRATISPEGDLIQTSKFSNEQNNKIYESDITFSKDLKTAFFTWNNFYNTLSRKDSAKWQSLRILKADLNDNLELINTKQVTFNSENYSVRNPTLSPDGKKLFFVSDIPGGIGKTDIYVVDIMDDGTLSEPKNLGPYINTTEVELFPFVDDNNTLYFSSYGRKGLGDLDIYKSEYKNGSYQPVEHLPAPINSNYDDFAYVTSNNGESGYISSNRRGGKGDADIYYFKLKEEICEQEIAFKFYNEENDASISDVIISISESSKEIDSFLAKIEDNPSYKFDCGKTFNLILEKEGFESVNLTLSIDNEAGVIQEQIVYFKPVQCKVQISGTVTEIESEVLLVNTEIKLMHNKNEVATTTTDENANFSFEVDCNKKYRIVASKNSYVSKEAYFSSNKKNNASIVQNFKLKSAICNQIVTGLISNVETNEKLSDAQVSLLKNDEVVQTTSSNIEGKFRFEIDCNDTYTLKVEKQDFAIFEESFNTNSKHKNIIPKNIKLTSTICNQLLSGIVTDFETKNAISGVQIQLIENNEVVDSTTSDNNGNYSFTLNCSSNYKIKSSLDNYTTSEFEWTTNKKHQNALTQNIQLQSTICNQILEGLVIDIDSRSVLEGSKVVLAENGIEIDSQTIGADGKFSFQIKCNSSYELTTTKTDFSSSKVTLTTNSVKNHVLTKNILLKSTICEQLISGIITDIETGKTLPNSKVTLVINDNVIDEVLTNQNGEYQFNVDCNTSYTISIAKADYFSTNSETATNAIHKNTLQKNFELKSSICNQTISGNISDIDTNNIIPEASVTIKLEGNIINEIRSDSNGFFSFDAECSKLYTIIVNAKNFVQESFSLETNSIHKASVVQNISLKSSICNQVVSGLVTDIDTKEAIPNATISIKVQGENQSFEVKSDNNGAYSFEVPCNKIYSISVLAENYKAEHFDIEINSEHEKNVEHQITLKSSICNEFVKGIVTNIDSKEVIENVEISVMVNENIIQTTTNQNDGSYDLKLNCGINYKLLFTSENFASKIIELNTEKINLKSVILNIELKSTVCEQTISGVIEDQDSNEIIENAIVSLIFNDEIIRTINTNADGSYQFDIDCEKNYYIDVKGENYISKQFEVYTNNIHKTVVKRNILLESLICYQTMRISLKNEFTNMPIPKVEVTIIKNETDVETLTTSNNGNLEIKLDCDANYQIAVQKNGFKNFSRTFNTDDKKYRKNEESFVLKPLTCSQPIMITVVDLITKKPLRNAKVQVNIDDILLTNNGILNYTLECKTDNLISINAENYLQNDLKVTVSETPGSILKYNIQLIPASEIVSVNEVDMLKLKTIPFDLDKDVISRSTAVKLNTVVDFLKSYPEYSIEVKNHTDSRAPDNYNLELSEKRAQSILNYMISQGVNPERVTAIGLGETELLNKCKNGVKCTEAEHQQNRRTEFILKK